ncbi:hypothetical protein IFE17_05465 [Actinobacillus sp. GY-402]|nr:hypothetical protein IFE17_05465 [Actinobacillus sp. GY-402]
MNHIYKVIWNKTTQSLVVVSELAASRSKTKSSKRRAKKIAQETIELFTKTVGTLTLGSAVLSSAPVVLTVGAAAIFKPSQAEAYVNNGSYATAVRDSVAIGANTTANYTANATGNESVAIGGRANSGGYQSLAIGTNTTASGGQSISIGSDVHATGYSSIAIGSDDLDQIAGQTIAGHYVPYGYTATHAAAAGAVVLGARSVASGRLSTILGSLSTASADGATVLGSGSNASGQSSTIVGFNSTASAVNATVVGSFSVANASNAIAIGTKSTAKGTGALAFGQNAISSGVNSVAMGATANATADGAIAIGDDSQATNKDALAQGKNTRASGNGSTAVGNSAKALANSSTALGNNANASQQFSTALGTGSKASESATAVGNDANASGFASFAASLNATASGYAANAIGFNSVSSNQSTIALGTNSTAAGERSISLGYNTTTTFQDSVAMGTNASAIGSAAVAIGAESVAQNNDPGKTNGATAIGSKANATGNQSVAIGSSSKSGEQATAIGNDSNAYGFGSIVIGGDDSGSSSGSGSDPYSSGSQYGFIDTKQQYRRSVATGIAAVSVGVHAQSLSNGSTAIGVLATAGDEVDTNTSTLASTAATEATAIGALARARNLRSTAIGYQAESLGNYSSAIGSNATANSTDSMALGSKSTANGTASLAAGYNATTNGTNALAIGSSAQALANNAISIGTGNIVSGENSGAIGDPTYVTGYGTYSIGNNNGWVTGNNSGIFGNNNSLTSDETRIIGNNNTIAADNTVAMGNNITVLNSGAINSIAIGEAAHTENANATAIGVNSNASAESSVSIGTNSNAVTENTTAIGNKAYAQGYNSTAIGTNASTWENNGVAIGSYANATGVSAISVGTNSIATETGSAAYGMNANASNVNALAIGTGTQAKSRDSVAIGNQSVSAEVRGVAIGTNANVASAADDGIAIGTNAVANGKQAIAAGLNASATANNTVAIGSAAKASGDSSFSGGVNSNASGNSSTAVGVNAQATKSAAVALGSEAKALSDSTIAIGNRANANAQSAVAVGENSNATGNFSTALGDTTTASGLRSVAVGIDANATAANAVAVGDSAFAGSQGALALGFGAQANLAHSVALGEGSIATSGVDTDSATVNGLTYGGFAGSHVNSTLSVGHDDQYRQIQKVAAGQVTATSTDAINGSQLYATQGVIGNVAKSVVENFGGNAAVDQNGNITFTNIGDTGENNVHNAIKAAKTEVKGGTNIAGITETKGANNQTIYTVNANGTSVSNGSGAVTINAAAAGNNITNYAVDLSQKTKSDIQQGVDANTTVNSKGITFAADSGTPTERKLGDTLAVNGDGDLINTTASAGKIAVAATDKLKDAVTNATSALQSVVTQIDGKDVKTLSKADNKANFVSGDNISLTNDGQGGIKIATKENVTFNTVNASTFNAGDVSISNNGINAGGKTVTNVANGTQDSDAVNFSQLNATNTNVANNAQNITNNANNITNNTNAINKGINFGNGTTATKFNLGDTINVTSDSNLVVSTVTDGVKLTLADSIAVGNVTVNNTFKAGDVTINNSGIDAGNHAITNVTAGTNATDAVNVAQLNASQSSVKAGDNVNVTSAKDANGTVYTVNANTSTVSNGSDKVTVTKTDAGNHTSNYAVDLSEQTKSDIQQGVDANTTVNSKGITFAADSGTPTERKLGDTLAVNGDGDLINTTASAGKIAVAATDKLKDAVTNATSALQSVVTQIDGKDVKTLSKADNKANFVSGDNISLTNDGQGGIKIATKDNVTFTSVNATTFNAGDVSISNNGINAGGKVVTNVANGTQDSDAVNFSQLNATNTNVANNAQNITNNANNISNNTKAIANNTQNITTNANNIAANTAAIKQGFNIGADKGADDNVQLGETVNYNGDSNIITTVSDNAIAFALNSSIAVDNVTVNNTFKAGDVTINKAGIDAGNHAITNVTAGTNATDAVNVAQLNASQSSVKAGDNVNVTSAKDANGTVYTVNANTSTVSNGSDKVTVTKTDAGNHTSNYAVDLSDAAKSSLTKADSALQSLTTSADGTTAQTLNQENSNANFISGNNIQLTPSANGITVATKADVTFTNVTATNVNGNTVTIGSGANTTTLTSTAEGLDMGGDKLTNISAGTNKTDAVNLGQLEKYIGDNSYNWNLSDGTNSNAVADNSTVAIKGSANADSAKTAGIVTALDGTNVSVDLSDKTKSDIQQGVDANTTVNSKGITFAADSGTPTERKLGDTLAVNGDGDLINTTASAGKIAVAATDKLKDAVTNATSALQSVVTQIDGKDVKTLSKADNKANFVSGDNISLTNDGQGGIKIATKENVTFNTVNASTFNAGDVSISNNGINAGGKTVTNVANGTKDSDAVNFSQLNATNTNVANNAQNITNNANNITNNTNAINKGINFGNGTTATKFNLGDTINVTSDSNLVVSTVTDGVKLTLADSIAVGNVTVNNTFKAGDVTINNSGINAGNHAITNVTAGTNATDAVNVGQLEKYVGDNAYNWNLSDGTNTNAVADNSTVAIKGSANADSAKTAGIVTALDGTNVSVDLSEQTKSDIQQGVNANTTVSKGFNIGADNGNDDNVQLGETVNYNGDSNIITTVSNNAIAFALNSSIAVDNVTVNNTLKAGDVTINNSGIDAGNHAITNVTAGTNATDAVNVAQLNASQSSVKAGDNVNVTSAKDANGTVYTVNANTSTVSNGSDKVTVTKTDAGNHTSNYAVDLSDAAKSSLTKADSALQSLTTSADGTTAQTLNQENSNANFISGNNIQLTPSANGITVATKADVTFTNVTATNVNGNTVTIGSGANTTTLTSTAEGLDVGGDKLTNISAGTNKTDAVNLGQLEKYIGDNSYNWNLSDGTTSNAVADNSTVAIKGSANADSAKTAGIVTALDGTNVSVDLSDKTKSDIQQGVNANTTVSKGFNIGADNGNDDNVQLGETVNYNGDSNIITTVSNNAIAFALNPSLNLTDAGSVTMGDVVVNNGGITIANGSTNNQAVSLTKDGLNNGGNKITNVANGTQDSDAVNLAQLNASQSSVKAGDNVNVTSVKDANGTVYTVNANTSTVSNGSDKVTVTKTDAGNHTSNYAVDLSQSAKDSLTKADSALQSWTAQVNGADAKVVNQTNNTVNFVNGTNTVVSADASGNISVSTAENVTFNTVNASTFNAGDVSISNNGINAGDKVVTNVANGTQDSDAVNFSQLNATNTNVANNAQNITNNANAIANNTQNITNNTNAINKGINFGNGTSANKFALGSTINVKPSDSNLVVKTVADGVELALADSIAVSNVTVNNTLKAGDVTINNSGIDAGNHAITNVTAGTNATDAVNLGQLEKYIGDNSYNWNLSDGTNSNAVADNSTVAIKGSANADSAKTAGIVTALDGTNVSVDLSEQTKSDIQQGVDANTTVNNKGITFAADSGAATERKLGETLTVNGDNDLINTTASAGKLEVAATDKLKEAVTNATSALQSVVTQIDGKDVKTLSKADNKANFVSSDNISLTNDGQGGIKVATKDNVTFTTVNATTFNAGDVSISNNGINAGGKTVTNVANGTQDSDAVNLSQLNATNTNVANNAQNITNNANNITNNTNAINKGINFGNGTSANNFALGSTINVTSDSNLVVSTVTDGVKLTLADSITVGNVTVNDTFKAGDVTINSAGIDAGDHAITNVTAGTNATDAVNVAQLEANTTRYYSVNSTATGNRKNDGATGANAMAAGANATASGDNATAIGQGTKANSASAIAIGNNANATSSSNDSVIAIGNNAQSTGSYSIAVGTNSVASNTWSMAMGISAKATGDYATGLGSNAQATAQWTTALGAGANATESAATAVGSNATAGADGATVIGYNSSVTGANTTALGNNINVGTEGSVVLGNNSAAATATTETAATVNNLTYSGFAGAGNVVAGDYVSVGSAGQERQIKYVTPGNISATSTDAINGSQLYATNRVLGNVANSVVNNFGGNAAVDSNGNITFTDIGGTGETTIHDAIKNVSDVANTGWNVQTNGDTATKVAPGDTVQFKDGKNIKITRTDKDITVATADDVSFNSITAGPVTINSNGIDAGSQKITNVATGTNGTDAVNLDQLNQTISASAYNWNISDGTNTADVPDNGTVAVKGSANADSANISGIVTTLDGTNVSVDLSDKAKDSLGKADTAIQTLTTSADGKLAQTLNKDDNNANFTSGKNIVLTPSATGIAIATADNVTFTTVNATTFNAGDVVVSEDGINAGNKTITNVAAGQNGTDAVNVDQLNAVNATANAGWKLTANGTNSSDVKPNDIVDLANKDGNINITKDGNNVTFDLNSNLTVGGKDGKDGQIGAMGANGTGVVLNGKDGTIGINGTDGTNGTVTLAQGPAGVDGVNGTDRIVYETPNGTSTVATLDDGLIFTGNNEVLNKHKLNSTVNIIGEGVDKDTSANFTGAAGNINVKADGNSTLVVQLAQDLVNLTSATFTNGTTNTVVNGNGVTINGGTNGVVSLTDTGLNNGNNTITNVSAGQNGTDAVNVDQLNAVNATANAGWKLTANGTNSSDVKPNDIVDLANKDGNINITKDGNNVTFDLNSNLTVGGKDGKDGQIGAMGANGTGVVLNGKDGTIGINGTDGTNGTVTLAQGPAGVDGVNGTDRIVYETPNGTSTVATLDDGFNLLPVTTKY